MSTMRDGGCISQNKFTVGMAILPPPPQYGWLTGQPSGPQHNQIAPAYSEPIGLVTVDGTNSSFTSISKISISLGGSSTRRHIGSSPLDPTGWLSSPRIGLPSGLRQSTIPQSYQTIDATVFSLLPSLKWDNITMIETITFLVENSLFR